MRGQSAGFWLWPLGTAISTAAAIALDIVMIAVGAVPAVPALLLTFAIPAVAGFALGLGNKKSGAARLLVTALITAGGLSPDDPTALGSLERSVEFRHGDKRHKYDTPSVLPHERNAFLLSTMFLPLFPSA